jgi:hypothetical protein
MKWQLSRWLGQRAGASERGAEAEIECFLVLGAVVQRRGDHYWIARDFESSEERARPGSAAPASR